LTTLNHHGQDAPAPEATSSVRIVKRYSNRKLYDTVASRYVTLAQIADLVRQGGDVRIIDNNTKEDLTRMTLAQILYEEERRQSHALPLTALKDLLHTSGERLISSLRDGPVGKLIGRGEPDPLPPEAPVAVTPTPEVHGPRAWGVQQFMEQSREAIDLLQHRVDDRMRAFWETINPAAQIQALQTEVRRLQQKIDALEARLGGTPRDGADEEKE
jgi:polyhydroxyalkanoate synthesis repressor PhaR